MAVKCGRGNHFHTSVDDVRRCYNGESEVETIGVVSQDFMDNGVIVAPDEPKATEKQIEFVCSLADQKETPTEAARIKALAIEGHWGRRSISGEIGRLKAMPRRPADREPEYDSATYDFRPTGDRYDYNIDGELAGKATESDATAQTPATLEAGMYRMGEAIYKVQLAVHGSGHPYAKRLEESDECRECGYPSGYDHEPNDGHEFKAKWVFNYASGAIRELRPEHRMTLDEAKAFGAIYGICCVCAAVLTNEVSIEAGIGPVCGGRV